jgi:hypothetical protein
MIWKLLQVQYEVLGLFCINLCLFMFIFYLFTYGLLMTLPVSHIQCEMVE